MADTNSSLANGSAASNGASNGASGELTVAQALMQKHEHDEAHNPTIEDTIDEDDLKHGEAPAGTSVLESADGSDAAPTWNPPMSSKAAGKQKVEEPAARSSKSIDTQSHESFPSLGGGPKAQAATPAPQWGSQKSTPAVVSNGTNGGANASSQTNGSAVTQPAIRSVPNAMKIPGRFSEQLRLVPEEILPRGQLKRPVADVVKDVNRRSKANLVLRNGNNGVLFIDASGPQDACRAALMDITNQVGLKQSIKVPIPQSSRAHIIGKGGANIKSLQERSGARIQVPKTDDTAGLEDDDEATVDLTVEGNSMAVAMARNEILKIVGERASTVSNKLRGIPAEFYPFLAGPNNAQVKALEDANNVKIQIPPHHTWTTQPPPQVPAQGLSPTFVASTPDNHITLAGERAAVMAARVEIERQARELSRQLTLDQLAINRGRHQFIIGERGMPVQEFLADTGCAIILPSDPEDDMITIVGPAEQIQAGVEKAMDLASSMQSTNVDISRQHRNAPGGAAGHARNVTRYLQKRNEIQRLERLHNAHIVTPMLAEGHAPWELYSRDGKNAIRAQSEITSIVNGHPPSRMTNIDIDPFFYQHLQKAVAPQVQETHNVCLVIPEETESGSQVLLVFEGPDATGAEYQVPRTQPNPTEIEAFQRGLEDARQHILEIISGQEEIIKESIDVPQKFHDKLRRFIKKEQEQREESQIPVRVSATGTVVTLRGTQSAVEKLAEKVRQFITQETEDEKERGFKMSFDFPQKHANMLIGKGGSNISALREKFDVDIQVKDGVVELTGPQAKAERAKAHIMSQGKQWADETTHTLRVDPKFHRELIGAQGGQINRLQTRYKVQIHFPRSGRPERDDQSVAENASQTGAKARRVQAEDEVTVRGPSKGADEARDEILSLLQYLKDNSHSASITIQQAQIPSLIGQGGKAMDELRQLTGARIDVPGSKEAKDPSGLVDIQIKGTKAQVLAAKKMIEEQKAVFDQTVIRTIDIDRKHHRALIGAGGSNLRDMIVSAGGSDDRRELARTVQFPRADSDGNSIKIEGKQEIVEKIIAAMNDLVAQRDSQVHETIDVPTDKHRSLIGRGGETKKDLERQFDVAIDIPRQGSGQTGVKLAGQPTGVANAKAHILDMIREEEGETVQVPRNLHHAVSDNGQFFRRLRNDHQVTVDHAGHKLPPKPAATNTRADGGALPLITDDQDADLDAHSWKVVDLLSSDIDGQIPWVLRGPPANIVKARAILASALEQAQKHTTTGYLVLPDPRTYRYVIGQGGSKVNSIRKQTGCRITVPRDQARDEAIIIDGSADGVERAKELILEAVKEGSASAMNGRN